MATLVGAPVLTPATLSDGDAPGEASPIASLAADDLRSSKVLRPYEQAGQKAVVISWAPENPTGAKIGSTKNLDKGEANEMILRVAVKLIKKRWPEIYPLLSVRLEKSLQQD